MSNTVIQAPSSWDAEQAILGGLMLDNDRWDEVILLLRPEDFYTWAHRTIYCAIGELAKANQPFDLITLSDWLENQQKLDNVGGFAYLADLAKNTPSAANILAYTKVVVEKSRLRQLQSVGHTLIADVIAPGVVAADVLESAEANLFQISEQNMTQGGGNDAPINELMDATISYLESRIGQTELPGTPTGFNGLNQKTGGFQSGDLILLAARPSMGKTALALASCVDAARKKTEKHVFVFSMEMPKEQLMLRMLSMCGRVELSRLIQGDLCDEEWARLGMAMKEILELQNRIIIDDTSYQTPATLRAKVRRYVRKYGQPALIMIDYIQLMQSPGHENRTQEMAHISRSIKALAKEFSCPVVALSQLNRQLENRADKRPNNGDLRESGALEQDADLILFIYRDEVYNVGSPDTGTAEIIISKQRNGPLGTIRVGFEGRYTLFSDVSYGEHV